MQVFNAEQPASPPSSDQTSPEGNVLLLVLIICLFLGASLMYVSSQTWSEQSLTDAHDLVQVLLIPVQFSKE